MSRGLCRISLLFSCLFVTRRWTRGALEQHRTPVRGFLAASFLYSAKALVDRHSSDLTIARELGEQAVGFGCRTFLRPVR